ncbi:MAG TPA: alpha/beta hydrolase [Candidatus Limnocylindria bacterium]|nr:alpha/beta hydrolase [Candidatus Limnocylindria bacterium]
MENTIERAQDNQTELEAKATSFNEQYDNPETIDVAEGTLKIYRATPEIKKHSSPILLGHGYPASPTVMKENLRELFEKGKDVIFPYTPRGIQMNPNIAESELSSQGNLDDIELKKASAFLTVIKSKDLKNINGLGFSEGALHIVAAALTEPERFKNLTLVNPAGVMGKTNFLTFLKGAVKHAQKETSKLEKAITTGKYLTGALDERVSPNAEAASGSASERISAELKSLWAIPKADILDALAVLEKRGIGIRIIHTEGDQIYPLSKIKKMLEVKGLGHLLQVEKGSHTAFSANPKRFGKIIMEAFAGLDKQKNLPRHRVS